jgi:putative oxidoreductase
MEPYMSATNSNTNSLILLGARVLLAAMFLLAGFPKLIDPSGTAGMIAGAGLPAATALAYIAGIFEVVSGLAILLGFQTKIAAFALALFCLFTAFVFHNGPIVVPDFPEGANNLLTMFNGLIFWKNIAVAGGFLGLAATGAGAYSIDGRRG